MKLKILACVMCMVLCISAFGIFSVSAAEERTLPTAIVTDCNDMKVLYVKGDGTLWAYNIYNQESRKLLDDVVYLDQGSTSMNFIAIQSDGTLWSCNVNYQDEFAPLMKNVIDAASCSFQDFANFAVTKDGKLLSWGRTENAEPYNCMGFKGYDGNYINAEDARVILENVRDVEACEVNVAALGNDGTLWRWGRGQVTPDDISIGISEIVAVTRRAIFALKENGDLFAWYETEGDLWCLEDSLFWDVKEFDIANDGMGYIDVNGELWLGYELDDFMETHFSTIMKDVKEVDMVEAYTKADTVPAFVLKNDNTLWLNGELAAHMDYIPYEEDFTKVMDNVDSFYTKGEVCCVITKDGKLHLLQMDPDFNGVDEKFLIGQVSDFAPSSWAEGEIATAVNLGILSSDMQKDYKANISRADFCEILTKTLEAKTGKNIAQIVEENAVGEKKNFNDTDSEYVDYMCRLGIVNGVSDNLFDPYAKITREAAAVMLTRAAKVLGFDTTGAVSTEAGVSSWAAEGVGYVTQNGIMNGTGNGFAPKGKYTKEQAIATFVRLYNK